MVNPLSIPAVCSVTPLVVSKKRPLYVPFTGGNGLVTKLACSTMLESNLKVSGFLLVVRLPVQLTNTFPLPGVAVRIHLRCFFKSCLPFKFGETVPSPLVITVKVTFPPMAAKFAVIFRFVFTVTASRLFGRSEERRVGKERGC